MSHRAYQGYDFQGNPLTEENFGKYLVDLTKYQKVIKDFGLEAKPYYEKSSGWGGKEKTKVYEPFADGWGLRSQSPVAGYDLSGDWSGAEKYLKDLGLTKFNLAPRSSGSGTGIAALTQKSWETPFTAPTGMPISFNNQISKTIFDKNPALYGNPELVSQIVAQNPKELRDAWKWIDAHAQAAAQKEKSSRLGGFGVVAKGLGTVGQFAGLASGLAGLTSGLGALTSGAGLTGAVNAGIAGAQSLPGLGNILSGVTGLSPSVSNVLAGGLTGAANGPTGALTGAVGGAVGGVPGSILSSLGSRSAPQATGLLGLPQDWQRQMQLSMPSSPSNLLNAAPVSSMPVARLAASLPGYNFQPGPLSSVPGFAVGPGMLASRG